MISTLQTNIPQEGGTVIFAYNLKECQGDHTITWRETGDTEWFTVVYQPGENPGNGSITISCGESDFSVKNLGIFPTINGRECNGITVTQVTCECKDIYQIIFPAISDEGIESGHTTQIGTWELASDSSCQTPPKLFIPSSRRQLPDGVEINTVVDPNNPKRGTFTVDYFPANEDHDNLQTWDIDTYYSDTDHPCTTYTLTQNSKRYKCDCTYARYFITVLKTTYTIDGTNGREILIGSGHTDCGYIVANADNSAMLDGDKDHKIRNEHEPNGDFSFYGTVTVNNTYEPGTQIIAPRSCGLAFWLLDPKGHPFTDAACQYGDSLKQDGNGASNACVCTRAEYLEDKLCITNDNYFHNGLRHDYSTGELVCDIYVYGEHENGKPFECMIIQDKDTSWSRDCTTFYVDYDENIFASAFGYIRDEQTGEVIGYDYYYDHFTRLYLNIKDGIWQGQDMTTTLRIREYTDATSDGYKTIRGYPCDDELVVTVNIHAQCSCQAEGNAYYNCTNQHEVSCSYNVDGTGGTISMHPDFVCATDFDYDTNADDDWIENIEKKESYDGTHYLELTVAPNTPDAEREFKVFFYPKINGATCGSYIYQTCYVTQPINYCSTCEATLLAFNPPNENVISYCDWSDCDFGFYFDRYDFNCGEDESYYLSGTVVSTNPSSLASEITYTLWDNRFHCPLNTTNDTWTATVRGRIVKYKNGTYSELFPNCYKEATVNILPCIPDTGVTCSCSYASFSDMSANSYPSGAQGIVLGESGPTDGSLDCLKYIVRNEQESCYAYFSGTTLLANLGTVTDFTNVSLTISCYKDDSEFCKQWEVTFGINP